MQAVEWHGVVHSNELQLSRDLEMVTLPGIKVAILHSLNTPQV